MVAAAKQHTDVGSTISDYHSISVKRGLTEKMRYGQPDYDFDEGVLAGKNTRNGAVC